MNYFFLCLSWVLYGALHSILATHTLKDWVASCCPRMFNYYRLFYNFLALVLFFLILWYQRQIPPVFLWTPGFYSSLGGGTLAGVGGGVLLMAIFHYNLLEFSGLDSFEIFQKTSAQLNTRGLSQWVRHPLYTGTLLVLWGLWIRNPVFSGLATAVCLSAYIRIGIYFEEKKLLCEFGENYRVYQQRVPMLFPTLFT
ncbi:methyltransferase family protein [Arundinibacter roseus]|uniref:Isoprenylcysteine carboxylmethyltransferase family protein n=1 Tax=Arundinibacter roseus TaxID=2070510 RepID=A0A4R4KB70_9BACT|nr:isoprenylcysteine carboxylmethyltransferase family protein [Arundinibacter roseus]TDB63409.1 isoprenylcysteine carboxylmethyltransferase family protein [Arundinibacter roseus]